MKRHCSINAVKPWTDTEEAVVIRYYRVPWGTPTVPYFHIYGSNDFQPCRPKSDAPLGVPGILWSGDEYDKGIPPVLHGTRQRACGSAEAWAGTTRANAPPLTYDPVTGVCTCCGVPPLPLRDLLLLRPGLGADGGVFLIVPDGKSTSLMVWQEPITSGPLLSRLTSTVTALEPLLIGKTTLPEGKLTLLPTSIYGGFLKLLRRVPSASLLDWTTTLAPSQARLGFLSHVSGTNVLALRSSAIPGGSLDLVAVPSPPSPRGTLRLVTWANAGRIALSPTSVVSGLRALEGSVLPTGGGVQLLAASVPPANAVIDMLPGMILGPGEVHLQSISMPDGNIAIVPSAIAQGVIGLADGTVIAGNPLVMTTDVLPAAQDVTMVQSEVTGGSILWIS